MLFYYMLKFVFKQTVFNQNLLTSVLKPIFKKYAFPIRGGVNNETK